MIIHGTDTMAFAASALSFMLENLQKPVILTGAQVTCPQLSVLRGRELWRSQTQALASPERLFLVPCLLCTAS